MHIAIDARVINSSTGRYIERLLFYLQKIDKQNKYTVLVREKDKKYWTPKNKNFSVKVAEFDNYSLNEQVGYYFFLRKLKPDLVHFCMPQQPILYTGKSITTFHDLNLIHTYNSDKNWLIYHIKQSVGRLVFYRVANKSDHIITPSEYTKKDLMKFTKINAKKITVTYESADIAKTKIKKYNLPFKDFILYVGQQPDYKNIRRLAKAHQNLLARHKDLGLVLVGKKQADTKANEKYFNDNDYKNILFTDFLPDTERDWLYKNCKAYIFPSLMEGFGLPGLEAMGYGAPIVSSNATCLPEIYGDAARYFNPKNVEDMTESIDAVLRSKVLRDNLVKKGYKQLDKYSWSRMSQQTHDIYMSVLEK